MLEHVYVVFGAYSNMEINYPANRFYRYGITAWMDRVCVVMYAHTDKHQTPVRGM